MKSADSKPEKEEPKATHAENEWGISVDDGEDESKVEEKAFVEVQTNQSLEDLMKSMKQLQTK